MVKTVKVGDRVQTLAVSVLWKREATKQFGEAWKTALVTGKVLKKINRSIDVELASGEEVRIGTRLVKICMGEVENGGQKMDETNYSSGSDSEDSSRSSSGDSSDDDSDSESHQGKSGDARASTNVNAPDEATTTGSSSRDTGGRDDPLLNPHGLKWKLAEVQTDIRAPDKHTPKLLWGRLTSGQREELDYLLLFYPMDHLEETLVTTNRNLKDLKQRELDKSEWFKFLGVLLNMSSLGSLPRDLLWAKRTDQRNGQDFGRFMKRKRFDKILQALQFRDIEIEEDAAQRENQRNCSTRQRFTMIQNCVDAFNKQRERVFTPGTHLCVDESVSEWRGKDSSHLDGCPHVTKIIRKPKGVGVEIKNLADAETGIMLALEVVDHKRIMNARPHTAQYGSGTAYLLRLAERFKGTGRAVNADSAFASVRTCVALWKELGLLFAGMVKTAHRKFPKDYLLNAEVSSRGEHIAALAEEDGVKLLAVGWADKKRKLVVSSYGCTVQGSPHKKRRWKLEGAEEKAYTKEVPRPLIVEQYFNAAAAIDIHNHLRQGSLSLETALQTHGWDIRLFATLFGMTFVDAYLAHKHFDKGRNKHQTLRSFQESLIDQLLENQIEVRNPARQSVSSSSTTTPIRQDEPVHHLNLINKSKYGKSFKRRYEANNPGKTFSKCRLRCRECSRLASYYCKGWSADSRKDSKCIVAICGPKSGRSCFRNHQIR